MHQTAIIVPVKFQSRRLKDKNLRLINDKPLYHMIIDELTSKESNWDIFIYSNNIKCLVDVNPTVKHLPRPRYLDGDAIKANELFSYATKILPHKVHAIVHPTCPFLSFQTISSCIEAVEQGGYDSAFTAERIQRYGWFNGNPLNYDPQDMVQTQELIPIMVENSGVYVYSKKGYMSSGARIGRNPFIKEISHKEAIDIDTEEDFKLAKLLAENTLEAVEATYSRSHVCKEPFPVVEHLVFDFDGVIGDTISTMEHAWSCVRKAFHGIEDIPPFENYRRFIGQPFCTILHNIGIDKKLWQQIEQLYFQETRKEAGDIKLYDGMLELLENLKREGNRLYLYTSKPLGSLNAITAYQEIAHMFDVVLTSDSLPFGLRGKPSGDGLRHLILDSKLEITNVLYVGDTISDAVEAQNAGCLFIRAEWAGHQDQEYLSNEAVVFSPAHLHDILTK